MMIKQIVADVYSQGNVQNESEFKNIIKCLENAGYEIIWNNYPTNAAIVKNTEVEE